MRYACACSYACRPVSPTAETPRAVHRAQSGPDNRHMRIKQVLARWVRTEYLGIPFWALIALDVAVAGLAWVVLSLLFDYAKQIVS